MPAPGWGGWLLTAGAAMSILGTNSASVLAGPRYLFALARDGYGPRWLAGVHPRFHTPAPAIVVQGLLALPLALTGSFAGLAALSVVARLTTYVGTAAAVPSAGWRNLLAAAVALLVGLGILALRRPRLSPAEPPARPAPPAV